jgi:hypothetical protein
MMVDLIRKLLNMCFCFCGVHGAQKSVHKLMKLSVWQAVKAQQFRCVAG